MRNSCRHSDTRTTCRFDATSECKKEKVYIHVKNPLPPRTALICWRFSWLVIVVVDRWLMLSRPNFVSLVAPSVPPCLPVRRYPNAKAKTYKHVNNGNNNHMVMCVIKVWKSVVTVVDTFFLTEQHVAVNTPQSPVCMINQ